MTWLQVERDGHVATVTLDRPPVNAVDREVMTEIRDVFAAFEADRDVRAVVFTAAGDRAFMGGADLIAATRCQPAT
jgi:enoyl-CoA hydratase